MYTYETSGTFDVMLVAFNVTSADTISQKIVVGENSGDNYFSVNGIKYPLTDGFIVYQIDRWHSIVLYKNLTFDGNWFTGIGNIVCLDIVFGAGKSDIVGDYSWSNAEFDGIQEDIDNATDFTIYNGFCALAYNYNPETESPVENDFGDDTNVIGFTMNIAKDGDEYIINISATIDGSVLVIYYKGEMQIIDEPADNA